MRAWIKQGLPALTEKRPYLILGWQLKAFLKAREAQRKLPRTEGVFFCLKCKSRRNAAFGLTEHVITADGKPILRGFCEVCETLCIRFLSSDEARKTG